jgi:predicted acyltransferase
MSKTSEPALPAERLLSIDALRGFDMFWIIGGGTVLSSLADVWPHPVTQTIKEQLEHVEWQGFRFEDLIFPLFLFIVGVVLPFSISRRRQQGQNPASIHLHILKRSVTIILLGLIFNDLLRFEWAQMRWPGVLQRIGLCYFFAAILVVHTRWRTQAIIVGAVLVLYWTAAALIPVPGFGAGVMTAEGCLSSYIDQQLIPGKLYYGYGDNEGLISTFPAVCTVLLGALAGHWLRSQRPGNQKAAGLAVAGLVCLAIGYLWGFVFPIIKIIWTSSYTLFSGGLCLMLLALFYWLIDVKGYRKWTLFFVVIGVNPITIYFLQSFVNFDGITDFFLAGVANNAGQVAPLVLPLGILAVKWLFLWFLYRHKILFKV